MIIRLTIKRIGNFNELNPVRALITDFGADKHLKHRKEILDRHGYTANDIDLIRNWFFIDSRIANSQTLQAMLAELGLLSNLKYSITEGWNGIQALWHPNLLPHLMVAIILTVLLPSCRVAASWGIIIVAVFIMGLIGRPGVVRVYVPLVSLLVIAPFLLGRLSAWPKHIGIVVLLVATGLNTFFVLQESRTCQIMNHQIRKELTTFPNVPIITWGAIFPFEAVYPVLATPSLSKSYQFYDLGVFTLAPFSVHYREQKQEHGMLDLLVERKGIPIIAKNSQFQLLENYCKEHLHGKLIELSVHAYGAIVISQRRCVIDL